MNKPPDEVFAYLDDLSKHPEWQPQIESRRIVTEGPTRVGTEVDDTRVDGMSRRARYAGGEATIPLNGLGAGRHSLSITVSDFQETKNMENVPQPLPNTRVLTTAFVVP